MKLFLTCEHGGNLIPSRYQFLFTNAESVLESHRGYDLGALDLFYSLKPLSNFSVYSEVTRLLVELNRSENHPQLFSEYTKVLSDSKKKEILNSLYYPYRKALEREVMIATGAGETVIHLSVHSFTPKFNGVIRNADIGLLYDPARKEERVLCGRMKEYFLSAGPGMRVRSNYPYLGKADSLTTYLRKIFRKNYLGIELEINQKFSSHNIMQEEIKRIILQGIYRITREKRN